MGGIGRRLGGNGFKGKHKPRLAQASGATVQSQRHSGYYAYGILQIKGRRIHYPDGSFKPENYITRTETITLVNRMLDRTCDKSYVDSSKVIKYTDVAHSYWGYYDIMESVNGHDYKKTDGNETWTKLR